MTWAARSWSWARISERADEKSDRAAIGWERGSAARRAMPASHTCMQVALRPAGALRVGHQARRQRPVKGRGEAVHRLGAAEAGLARRCLLLHRTALSQYLDSVSRVCPD